MCACVNGIITNDMGDGRYQIVPCSCQEAERSREEHMKNYNAWLEKFNKMYDAYKGGQCHGESKSIA